MSPLYRTARNNSLIPSIAPGGMVRDHLAALLESAIGRRLGHTARTPVARRTDPSPAEPRRVVAQGSPSIPIFREAPAPQKRAALGVASICFNARLACGTLAGAGVSVNANCRASRVRSQMRDGFASGSEKKSCAEISKSVRCRPCAPSTHLRHLRGSASPTARCAP
jgi:hypothetical protein